MSAKLTQLRNAVGAAVRQSGTVMSAKLRQLRNAVGAVFAAGEPWSWLMDTSLGLVMC